jgi:Coenzyme PQQ synthesis protein D (PqqD)
MKESLKNIERLSRNTDCIFREEEDGAFLFDPESGNLKFINSMGVNIYQLCDGKMTVGDITSLVRENYKDISSKQIEDDINVFLQELVKMEFLKREEVIHDGK